MVKRVKREYSFYPLTVCGVRGTSKSKRYGKEGILLLSLWNTSKSKGYRVDFFYPFAPFYSPLFTIPFLPSLLLTPDPNPNPNPNPFGVRGQGSGVKAVKGKGVSLVRRGPLRSFTPYPKGVQGSGVKRVW